MLPAILLRFCGSMDSPPRVLVVAAHPDDDVIGAGARIAALGTASIAYLTDGAPRDPRLASPYVSGSREAYSQVRHDEALAALRIAGVPGSRVHWMGGVDQEAFCALAPLTRRLAAAVAVERPEVILTHPYEGGHPDHDAAAFCSWAAVRLAFPGSERAPAIVEMTSYHADDGAFRQGAFLPSGNEEIALDLEETVRATKRAMIACHHSQRDVLASFTVGVERFRMAPRYDFAAPPHGGRLWYELRGWMATGDAWRAEAQRACRELLIEEPCRCTS